MSTCTRNLYQKLTFIMQKLLHLFDSYLTPLWGCHPRTSLLQPSRTTFQTCLVTMPHYCVTFVPGIFDGCGLLSGGLLSPGLLSWILITQYATPQPAHLRCRIDYTPSLIVFTFNLAVVSIVTSSVFITKRGVASSVSLR